jgi:hypothetical protein
LEGRHHFRWFDRCVDVPAAVFVPVDEHENKQPFVVTPVGIPINESVQPLHEQPELVCAGLFLELHPGAVDLHCLLQCEGDCDSGTPVVRAEKQLEPLTEALVSVSDSPSNLRNLTWRESQGGSGQSRSSNYLGRICEPQASFKNCEQGSPAQLTKSH